MENLKIGELLWAAWRRKWWVVVPVICGLGVAMTAIRWLPATYRASTLVLVEPQTVPDEYIRTTVTTSMQERLKTIEQQITNRSNLEQIITEMNLYPELRAEGKMSEAVGRARAALGLQVQGDRVFRIYFTGPDPTLVAATSNRITDLFIEQNLKLREDQAEGTTAFLEAELREIKASLEEKEERIGSFKQVHLGELPEQRESNMRAVEQFQAKLEINVDALDKAEMRKLYLQRQIAENRPLAASPPTTVDRLQQLREQLAELRSTYTDRHPEVIRLQKEIERVTEEYRTRPAPPPASPVDTYDPIAQAELAQVEMEIRSLRAEQERILQDIGRYQGRLETTPRVETELLTLTRDYDNIQKAYDSLLSKRLQAQLAQNLEKRQQSEQFRILERAWPAEKPYSPNSILLLALGLAGGLLAGLALAFMRQQTDQTYHDARTLQEAFPGVPVLGVVPVLERVRAGQVRG